MILWEKTTDDAVKYKSATVTKNIFMIENAEKNWILHSEKSGIYKMRKFSYQLPYPSLSRPR